MNHYLEIRLLPDPEFVSNILMNALYSKLHRALVALKPLSVGVSFPAYSMKDKDKKKKTSLGDRLRLHGLEKDLQTLMATEWLTGMNDHVRVSKIYPVPGTTKQVLVKRVQVISNADQIRRRQMKRYNWTWEQAVEKIPKSVEKRLDYPFVSLKSKSTGGNSYRLFIKQQETEISNQGEFNTYGLSKTATLPWF